MAKYKVLEDFNLNGIIQKAESLIDLDFRLANLKSIQKMIEKVPDSAAPKDTSALGGVTPGVPLTPEQKEKLAKENIAETTEAQRLAAEHRARDLVEGKGEPVVNAVAEALKEKLTNEEFEKKGGDTTPPAAPTE